MQMHFLPMVLYKIKFLRVLKTENKVKYQIAQQVAMKHLQSRANQAQGIHNRKELHPQLQAETINLPCSTREASNTTQIITIHSIVISL